MKKPYVVTYSTDGEKEIRRNSIIMSLALVAFVFFLAIYVINA